jgi:hypothetical protein
MFRLTLFALVLSVLPSAFAGDDPVRDRKARAALALAEPKDGERDRCARAALALSAAERTLVTAPAPHAKDKPPCPCGDNCKCKDGTCPACPAAAADLAKVRDSLVRVNCGRASGSGTVVWSEGGRSVVLTAAHVVETADDVTVRGSGKTHKAQIIGADAASDLAALLVAAELPAVKVSAADPVAGTEVLMVGCTSLWSRGTVEGFDRHTYLLGYDSDSGDSGAGVFVAGELVGVHCGKVGPTAETCTTPYCCGAKPVRAFLAKVFRRAGNKTVPVEPAAAIAAAKPKPDEYDTWLVNGQFVRVPKGQRPSFAPACPNGRCPLQK